MTLDELHAWARGAMNHFGLHDWNLIYEGGRPHSLGYTNHGAQTIGLGALHMFHASVEEQKDTVLHEIAHALVGADAGHGARWKAMARAVGAQPDAKTEGVIPVDQHPVQGRCAMGCYIGKSRMPPTNAKWLCAKHRSPVHFVRVLAKMPAEVERAVKRYGVQQPNLTVGCQVVVHVPGHKKLDQKHGRVLKIARTRATVVIQGSNYILPLTNLQKV